MVNRDVTIEVGRGRKPRDFVYSASLKSIEDETELMDGPEKTSETSAVRKVTGAMSRDTGPNTSVVS